MAADSLGFGGVDWRLLAAAWLLTYVLHSTFLLISAWLLTSRVKRLPDAMKEMMWRVALLGPVLTATLQLTTDVKPVCGHVMLTAVVAADDVSLREPGASPVVPETALASPAAGAGTDRVVVAQLPAQNPNKITVHQGSPFQDAVDLDVAAATVPPTSSRSRESWMGIVWWSGLAGCVGGLLLAGAASFGLRVRLAGRSVVTDGRARLILDRLSREVGIRRKIRLTCSNRIPVPIALGIVRREICLPARALGELRPAELQCVLAHELAHLLRCDPGWMALCRLVETVLFFQPLNRLGCRKLRELAEFRCDAWAAAQTGDRLTLARCLTEVAGWIVTPRAAPAMARAAGMAGSPSSLRRRIGRLLDDTALRRGSLDPRWLVAFVPAVVVLVTVLVPGVNAAAQTVQKLVHAPEMLPPSGAVPDAPGYGSVDSEIAALVHELAALDHEIARLQEAASRVPTDGELGEMMEHVNRRARELRHRRDRLVALLEPLIGGPVNEQSEAVHSPNVSGQ